MPYGVFRRVVLIGPWALKFPRLNALLPGMQCNRWEREMWQVWRPIFHWSNLCPVLASDPLGLVVVMPRAFQPVSREEVEAADPDDYPSITAETKPDDYGRIGTKVFALDYGLPDKKMTGERRAYYAEMATRRSSP
jgi:hypothetical protein